MYFDDVNFINNVCISSENASAELCEKVYRYWTYTSLLQKVAINF